MLHNSSSTIASGTVQQKHEAIAVLVPTGRGARRIYRARGISALAALNHQASPLVAISEPP